MKNRPIAAAFDQGETPTIVCINASTVPFASWQAGKDFAFFIALLQEYADIFAGVWHTPCKLVVGDKMVAGQWAAVFTDNATVAGALGYHDTTPDGLPLAHNFVQTSLADGELPSVTASHELAEMLVDPAVNLCAMGPRGLIYAYESCDAVERETFPIGGVQFSDFVYPAWFEMFRRAKYDYLGRCQRPFQILPGGYMPVLGRRGWTQIFGSTAAEKKYKASEHRRSQMRGRQLFPSW